MKAIAVVLLLSVVVGAWTAEDETFTSDFTTTEGVAREVQSVAVERNPELAVPAATVAHLPEHDSDETADEDAGAADEEVAEESFLETSATPAEAAALKEAAATLAAAATPAEAAAKPAAGAAPAVSPQVAEIVRKVAAIVTLIPKVPTEAAGVAGAAAAPGVATKAAAAAAGKPQAPPAGAKGPAAGGPGAIPAGSTAAAAVAAAPPAPPVPGAAPKPAPRPANPLVKKVINTNAMPPMAGPPTQDVSAKKLRQAQIARTKAELVNRRLRNKLKRLRKRMQRRIRMEQEKCAGKCDRKFPVTVGPHHIPSTETRAVVMEGDRAENKKRWSAVSTHKKLMWLPKKLKKVYKFHDRVGKRIRKHHDYIKKTRAAPLVERHGKFIVKNWKDYDVMKEFK